MMDVRWRKMVRLALDEKPSSVLDLGCSSGDIAALLVERGVRVIGLEHDPGKAAQAAAKGVTVARCDLSAGIPCRSGSFTVIVAGEIIEHLIDTDFFLGEIHRVLSPGGTLIMSTPNLINLENRLRILIGRYPIFVDYTSRQDNHVRVYTERALTRQLKEKKFMVEYTGGSFVPCISYSKLKKMHRVLMPLASAFGAVLPRLALHTIVKARKPRCDDNYL